MSREARAFRRSFRRSTRASFHFSSAAIMWLAAWGGTKLVSACKNRYTITKPQPASLQVKNPFSIIVAFSEQQASIQN